MTLNISSSKPKTNRLRLTRTTREALNSRRNNPTFLNGTSPYYSSTVSGQIYRKLCHLVTVHYRFETESQASSGETLPSGDNLWQNPPPVWGSWRVGKQSPVSPRAAPAGAQRPEEALWLRPAPRGGRGASGRLTRARPRRRGPPLHGVVPPSCLLSFIASRLPFPPRKVVSRPLQFPVRDCPSRSCGGKEAAGSPSITSLWSPSLASGPLQVCLPPLPALEVSPEAVSFSVSSSVIWNGRQPLTCILEGVFLVHTRLSPSSSCLYTVGRLPPSLLPLLAPRNAILLSASESSRFLTKSVTKGPALSAQSPSSPLKNPFLFK